MSSNSIPHYSKLMLNNIMLLTFILMTLSFININAEVDYYPRNIHLSLQGEYSQRIRVQWTTTTYKPDSYQPVVHYGHLTDNLLWSTKPSQCTTTTYTQEEYHHTCLLWNTRASNRYYYRIGVENGQTSPVASFYMPPTYGSVQKSILIGDLGLINGENTARTLKLWTNGESSKLPKIAHINHCGDIAYSDDYHRGKPNPDFERINNEFAEMIEPITKAVPYMVAVGNHDISASLATPDEQLPEWGRNCTHYNHRWAMPSDSSNGVMNMWYSYTIGNTRFIVINTETDSPDAPFQPDSGSTRAGGFGDQVTWLKDQLDKANRPEARLFHPWVVVIGHRPMYSTLINDYPADQQGKTRAWLEPLFKDRVDLYVSGHLHLYERTYPMYEGKILQKDYFQPHSFVSVTNGAAGNLEGYPIPGTDILEELPEHIPIRIGESWTIALLETFSTLPPNTTYTYRDNNIGDYHNFDRLENYTPTPEDQTKFFTQFDEKLKQFRQQQQEQSKDDKKDDKKECPPKKSPISLCYSVYPVFASEEMFATQSYLDRFCIIKCL